MFESTKNEIAAEEVRAAPTTPAMPSSLELDRQMVEAVKKDRAAFAALYDRYFQTVYSYAYRRTANHAEAEDVTAQTFQQAFEHVGTYEWRGIPFAAWLFRIASNLIVRRGTKASALTPLDETFDLASDEPDPDLALIRGERSAILRKAIATLPPDQQRALVLKFSRDLKNKEIADVMGRTEGSVKQLLHRAILSLRSRVELDSESE
jgi:RNA polymerase sigma-70 factor, ECF subfamily